jgi:PhoPQ-activated pathogenicity-related protein
MLRYIKYLIKFIIIFSTITYSLSSFASSKTHTNYSAILNDYLQLEEPLSNILEFKQQSQDATNQVTKLEYILNSQIWPKVGLKSDQKVWQHHLNIYIPQHITSHTALLWINGGTSYQPTDEQQKLMAAYYTPSQIDFNKIANDTHSIVIDLQDVPNQYITLNGEQYAEDGLVAYTWAKFIEDPVTYKFYSAYLPMVKTVIQTMNQINTVQFDNKNLNINKFVLAGSSKRGLTTWLTALHDDRIQAIIPVAIDILNFEANIKHIYQSHQDWPIALRDYYEHNIVQQLDDNNNIKYLMQINDPFQYMQCQKCDQTIKNKYKQRANIDKYLILASGDDFFTPDSLLFYFDKLPGKTYLRYIPNSSHRINYEIVTEAVLTYFNDIINKTELPLFSAKINKNTNKKEHYTINVTTNIKPKTITIYTAQNLNKRDFRLANKITYQENTIEPNNYDKSMVNKTEMLTYNIPIMIPKHGWQAYFVELEYENTHQELNIPNLKLTTPIAILPMKYPHTITQELKSKLKKLVQYGKTVIYN